MKYVAFPSPPHLLVTIQKRMLDRSVRLPHATDTAATCGNDHCYLLSSSEGNLGRSCTCRMVLLHRMMSLVEHLGIIVALISRAALLVQLSGHQPGREWARTSAFEGLQLSNSIGLQGPI